VPEPNAGLSGIPGLPWESLSHRQVLAELAARGWVPCGVGDWAVALRSPEGILVARVCPFDPAYWAFVDLCRACPGNRWLPRIELAAGLEGGGSVVFLIYRAADGRPVLLDVFCMAGGELYRAILDDVAAVHRRIPRERMRYALDIPYIARENSAAEILALKNAWARAAD
jgi:hypothetical protein